MSRPLKQGLEYFYMSVETDDKFELIEANHGITGFGVVIKLYQRIFKQGYYLNFTEESAMLFSKRINVDHYSIMEILRDCFKYGIFDKFLYEKYCILTSAEIQEEYLMAVERMKRREVKLCREFILDVDTESIKKAITWSNYCEVFHNKTFNSGINPDNSRINPDNSGIKRVIPRDTIQYNTIPYNTGKPEENFGLLRSDFIEKIIQEFLSVFPDYVITNSGQERTMAAKLVNIYKKKYPDSNSEQTLSALRHYFELCSNVPDAWLRNNMSLSTIVNKFNSINNILKNGKSKGSGVTDKELAELLAGKIGAIK